jgi:hypothetical protein
MIKSRFKILALCARPELNSSATALCELEYWSIGVLLKDKMNGAFLLNNAVKLP